MVRGGKEFTGKGFSLEAGNINLDKQGAWPVQMTQIAASLGSIKHNAAKALVQTVRLQ